MSLLCQFFQAATQVSEERYIHVYMDLITASVAQLLPQPFLFMKSILYLPLNF